MKNKNRDRVITRVVFWGALIGALLCLAVTVGYYWSRYWSARNYEKLRDEVALVQSESVTEVQTEALNSTPTLEEIEAAEFALSAEMATPLETAPYYVEKVTVRTFGTIPGLEINEKCQIITAQGETVPGLYGSGELVAGNAFTRQYPGIGIGISFAGNSGRFAVSQILEDLK